MASFGPIYSNVACGTNHVARKDFTQQGSVGWVSGRTEVPRFSFRGLGCRKFTITVRLSARVAAVQFANLSDGSATRGAAHREYLFRGQIFGLHISHLATVDRKKMLNIAHFKLIGEAGDLDHVSDGTTRFLQTVASPNVSKSDHFPRFHCGILCGSVI